MRLLTDNEKVLACALSIHRTTKNGYAKQCEIVSHCGITKNLVQIALNQIQKRIIHNEKKGIECNFDQIINDLKRLTPDK